MAVLLDLSRLECLISNHVDPSSYDRNGSAVGLLAPRFDVLMVCATNRYDGLLQRMVANIVGEADQEPPIRL